MVQYLGRDIGTLTVQGWTRNELTRDEYRVEPRALSHVIIKHCAYIRARVSKLAMGSGEEEPKL